MGDYGIIFHNELESRISMELKENMLYWEQYCRVNFGGWEGLNEYNWRI